VAAHNPPRHQTPGARAAQRCRGVSHCRVPDKERRRRFRPWPASLVQRKPSAGWTKAAHGVIGAAARERGRTGWKAADVLVFKPKPTLSGAADAVAAIRTAVRKA
jgi:hypothetical protein